MKTLELLKKYNFTLSLEDFLKWVAGEDAQMPLAEEMEMELPGYHGENFTLLRSKSGTGKSVNFISLQPYQILNFIKYANECEVTDVTEGIIIAAFDIQGATISELHDGLVRLCEVGVLVRENPEFAGIPGRTNMKTIYRLSGDAHEYEVEHKIRREDVISKGQRTLFG